MRRKRSKQRDFLNTGVEFRIHHSETTANIVKRVKAQGLGWIKYQIYQKKPRPIGVIIYKWMKHRSNGDVLFKNYQLMGRITPAQVRDFFIDVIELNDNIVKNYPESNQNWSVTGYDVKFFRAKPKEDETKKKTNSRRKK